MYLFIFHWFHCVFKGSLHLHRKEKHNKSREWSWFNNEIFFYFCIGLVLLSVCAWRYMSYSYSSASLNGNRDASLLLSFLNYESQGRPGSSRAPAGFPLMESQELVCLSHEGSARPTAGEITGLPPASVLKTLQCSYSFPAKLWCVHSL